MSMFYKAKQMLVQFLSLIHILDNKNKLFFFICIQVFTRENNFLGGGPPYNLHMFLKFKVTLVNVTREKKVHISTKKLDRLSVLLPGNFLMRGIESKTVFLCRAE